MMLENQIMDAAYLEDWTEVEHLLNQMFIKELKKFEVILESLVERIATTIEIKENTK